GVALERGTKSTCRDAFAIPMTTIADGVGGLGGTGGSLMPPSPLITGRFGSVGSPGLPGVDRAWLGGGPAGRRAATRWLAFMVRLLGVGHPCPSPASALGPRIRLRAHRRGGGVRHIACVAGLAG